MKITMLLTAALLTGSLAFTADAEKKSETTMDTSKNPITGTVTKKKTHKSSKKGPHGDKTVEVTEKTKTHTDGKVETTTETKTESEKH